MRVVKRSEVCVEKEKRRDAAVTTFTPGVVYRSTATGRVYIMSVDNQLVQLSTDNTSWQPGTVVSCAMLQGGNFEAINATLVVEGE